MCRTTASISFICSLLLIGAVKTYAEETPSIAMPAPQKVEVKTEEKIKFSTDRFSYQWGAKLLADWASFDQDIRREEFVSSSEIRSFELKFSGIFESIWKYKLAVDFSGNEVGLSEGSLGLSPTKWAQFDVGLIAENFSLDEAIGTTSHLMMEKSLAAQAFGGDDRIGAMLSFSKWHSGLGLGAFDSPPGDDGEIENRTRAYNARLTTGILRGEWGNIHGGFSYREQSHKGGDRRKREVRFSARPGVHVSDLKLVDTGNISYTKLTRSMVFEGALRFHRWLVFGEYYKVRVIPFSPAPHGRQSFDGGHLTQSYTFIGKPRDYEDETGSFGSPESESHLANGGPGAWEWAFRLDRLNLNSGPFRGGKQTNYGTGINWFPSNNIRFSANYIQVNSHKGDLRDRPRLFALRTQFSF